MPVLAGLVIVLAVAGAVLLRPRTSAGALDPGSPTPDGARAVAEVLKERGVEVLTVRTAAQARSQSGPSSTLLVVGDELLTPEVLDDLETTAGTVVLVRPDAITLEGIGAPLQPAGSGDTAADPGCDLPAAQAAGRVETETGLYVSTTDGTNSTDGTDSEVTLCYPQRPAGAEEASGLAVWEHDAGRLVVLGSTDLLTNGEVADAGRSALSLWSLGSSDRLVWWMVSPDDPTLLQGPRPSPAELLPAAVPLVLWQLVGVTLLAMWWRGRRLGRLVPEPLPVVVRSSETSQGRAALYRRAGARDRAATVLRAQAVGAAGRRLGLTAAAGPGEVVDRTAGATSLPPARVQHLLFGPPPATDPELSALADELDLLLGALSGPGSRPSPRKARPS